jgi:ubiquinone/menaquinone biosynthesis C-methylase UbiE
MSFETRPVAGPLSVAQPWDLVSAGYTAELAVVMLPFTQHAIALAEPKPAARVIDVATGPGVLALELAPRVEHVDAIDFSPSMLAELERRRVALGIENVTSAVADGQALPFAGASFDCGFSMFGLMFFPDRKRGFAELFRVLRPGGVAVVSSWAPVDQSSLMRLMFGALRAADPTRAAPQTNWLSLENPEVFRAELEGAGFSEVKITPYTHSLAVSDADELWRVMARSSAPLVLLRERLGEEEWSRQSELARAYVAEQLRETRELSTTAYLGFGRR